MKRHKILYISCCVIVLCTSLAHGQQTNSYAITWDPISDPTITDVLVYRSLTTSLGDFVLIGSTNASQTKYVDSGREKGIRYYYRLRSRDAGSNMSQFSVQVSAMTLSSSDPEYLQNECRIDSATALDNVTSEIAWATESSTTGKIKYWRMGEPLVSVPSPDGFQTYHRTVLNDLVVNDVYFAKAVAHDGSGNLTVSADYNFTTDTVGVEELEFLTSTGMVFVPEEGTEEFRIKLNRQPSEQLGVSVTWTGGDGDITVVSGGTLIFDQDNWSEYQVVTLAAADDEDVESDTTQISVQVAFGPEIPSFTVTAIEIDNDILSFVVHPVSLTVPEGGTADFTVRLSKDPSSDVEAAVSMSSGDTDLFVQDGETLIFTTGNWDIPQTVTLAAADDADLDDGQAVFILQVVSAHSISEVEIAATEDDDDVEDDPRDDRVAAGMITMYPMPFIPDEGELNIDNLPSDGGLEIFDMRGRKVWVTSWSGRTSVKWDGSNVHSTTVSSGRYFVVVRNRATSAVEKKAILVVR